VILPYAEKGEAMLWQAQAGMYFNMAEGAGWSDAFRRWPIALALSDRSYVPHGSEQLRAFLAAHDVSAILVADQELAIWRTLFSVLDPAPLEVGGISLYRVTKSTRPGQSFAPLFLREIEKTGQAPFPGKRVHTLKEFLEA